MTIETGWVCKEDTAGKSACKENPGDGIRTKNEECDDGNPNDGDGCSSEMKIEKGWSCKGAIGTKSLCATVCGDEIKTNDEECDDGNKIDGDGCSSTCKIEKLVYKCKVLPGETSSC